MSAKRGSGHFFRTVITLFAIAAIAANIAVIFFNRSRPPESIHTDDNPIDISSTDITEEPDTSAEVEPIPEIPDSATLMFGGDILIHESVFKQAKTGKNTYDFTPYFELFRDVFISDYNAVNLETPIDINGGNESITTYPAFNAPIELLDAIKSINIDLCTNSNNHMIDYGFKGLKATIANLDAYGFDRLGTYLSQEEHDQLFIKEINGIRIGFLAYTQTTNGITLNAEREAFAFDRMGKSVKTVDDILPRVEALRAAGAEIVIAVLHWGTEYETKPSDSQRKIAEALCEGGVDIIIGSHPHVVQPIEKMTVTNEDGSTRDCLIVYSLGNLFCNQSSKKQCLRGMVVALRFERGEDGIARLDDSFYMPTLFYATGNSGADFTRLVPAAQYIGSDNIPELLDTDTFRDRCSDAWEYVTSLAGDSIPAVTDPAHYPEGFFTSSETDTQ